MGIKFGDLLENVNADRAIIDLVANNAKGVLFVSDFDDTDSNQATNSGVAGIPEEKRATGSVVVDKTNGLLYVFTGSVISEHLTANPVTAAPSGSWEDFTGDNWVQVGKLVKRDEILYANIGAGPTPFGAGTPSNVELKNKINELISNPPRTFGKFLAGQTVVEADEELSALEIIVRALSDHQSYDLTMTASGDIEYGQTSGTITLTGSVAAINYNLTATGVSNVVPTKYRFFYREQGDGTWIGIGGESNFAAFTDTTTAQTFSVNHVFSAGDIDDQFDFDGFEYKVEIRDNSDEPDIALDGVGLTQGQAQPVIARSSVVTVDTDARVSPLITFSASRSNNESSMGNASDQLRTKGNAASILEFNIVASSENADGPANVTLPIEEWSVEFSVDDGAYGSFGTFNNTSGSNLSGTGSANQFTGVNTVANNFIANSTDKVEFRVGYKLKGDASLTYVDFPDATIEFRYPIFAGFSSAGGGLAPITSFPAAINSDLIEGLSMTMGGWSGNPGNVDPVFHPSVSPMSFPRLDTRFGHENDSDNTINLGLTNDSGSGNGLGYIHNAQDASGGPIAGFADGDNGVDVTDNSRFIFAIPDDSCSYQVVTTAFSSGSDINQKANVTVSDTGFGVSKQYRVSISDTANAFNSSSALQVVQITAS